MAYIIQFTSSFTTGQKPSFVIDDYRVNGPINPTDPTPALNADNTVTNNTVATPLLIYGKHMPNWGEKLEENLIHVLENFCDDTPPVSPTKGQKWFDSSTGRFMFFTGFEWASCDSVIADATAPADIIGATNPNGAVYDILLKVGQLWFDTTTNQLKIYDGVSWISASSNYIQKAGDTMDLNADLTFNGGEILGLPATPSATAATSKEYVDTQLSTHSGNQALHLTTHQNTLLDNIESMYSTLTAMELGALDDFNTGLGSVQTQLDSKLNLSGSLPMSGDLNLNSNKIINLSSATVGTDAINRNDGDSRYLQLSVGGIVSGNITMSGAEIFGVPAIPSANDAAASKLYVDNAVIGGTVLASAVQFTPYNNVTSVNVQNAIQDLEDIKLSYAGGTLNLNADITFNGGEVLGLPTTPSVGDAATSKTYVDNKVAEPKIITRTVQVSPGYVATNPGTAPSYIVGNNNLWIFVNGQKLIMTYAYDEVGTIGTASTSITWQTTIPVGEIIEYLVF